MLVNGSANKFKTQDYVYNNIPVLINGSAKQR